jgi:hypothetical protein
MHVCVCVCVCACVCVCVTLCVMVVVVGGQVEAINGAVVRGAAAAGLPAPLNEAVLRLVAALAETAPHRVAEPPPPPPDATGRPAAALAA